MNAGVRWLGCIEQQHYWRVNIKALVARGRLPRVRHFNMQRLDVLYDLLRTPQHQALVLPGWVRTDYCVSVSVVKPQHGSYYAQQVIRQQVAANVPAAAAAGVTHMSPELSHFLGDLRARVQPLLTDMRNLIGLCAVRHEMPAAAELMECAFKGGWLVLDSIVSEANGQMLRQQGWNELRKTDYVALSQQCTQRTITWPVTAEGAVTTFSVQSMSRSLPDSQALPVGLAAVGAAMQGGVIAQSQLIPAQLADQAELVRAAARERQKMHRRNETAEQAAERKRKDAASRKAARNAKSNSGS